MQLYFIRLCLSLLITFQTYSQFYKLIYHFYKSRKEIILSLYKSVTRAKGTDILLIIYIRKN